MDYTDNISVRIEALALLKKTPSRCVELWIIEKWLEENYKEEISKYSMSNDQPKEHDEDYWGSTAETMNFFKLSRKDLFALRKAGYLKEGIHFKRSHISKTAPLFYHFYQCCSAVFGMTYEQFINPSYNLQKSKSLQQKRDSIGTITPEPRKLFAVGGKK